MSALKQHGLSVALIGLWLVLLTSSAFTDPAGWLGQVLVNHAADAFGATVVVVLTKYLYERGSPASKQPGDRDDRAGG